MKFKKEEFEVMGKDLVEKVKQIINEGNARRIVVKHNGNVIVEFPLTIGVVGVVLAPILAAVGAIAALVSKCTVEVERK